MSFVLFIALLLTVLTFVNSDTLFLSPHHYPNLYAFDIISQSIISTNVLDIDSTNYDSDDLNWRGMKLDSSSSTFYAANSKKNFSFVGTWKCGNSFPLSFTSIFTEESSLNFGLDHPYELFLYPDSTNNLQEVYVSTQNTESVLGYNNIGEPVEVSNGAYPGAIISYPLDISDSNGLRGITVSLEMNLLFASMETLNMVLVYDINNNYKNIYNISFHSNFEPVGVLVSPYSPFYLFIGDIDNDSVYCCAISMSGCDLLWQTGKNGYDDAGLDHPAGLALRPDGTLFVVSQNEDQILQFDNRTGNIIGNGIFYDYGKTGIKGETLLYDSTGCGTTSNNKWKNINAIPI